MKQFFPGVRGENGRKWGAVDQRIESRYVG
jgi:hypothetical protein